MKNKNLPTKKQQTQVTKYNPTAAKVAKENLLKHVDSYPKVLTEENIRSFYNDGKEYLKIYQAEWKPIQDLNKSRLETEKLLTDKLKEAKREFDKIAQLKVNANSQIQFYAQSTKEGEELEKWNEYFAKYGKYTTCSYSDFEKICNQYQLQRKKEQEKEKLSKFEQLLNEPSKIESVDVTDVEKVSYKTKIIVDFEQLDCQKAIQVLVDAGKSEHIIEMLRIALKDSKEEIKGIAYVEEVTQRITRN